MDNTVMKRAEAQVSAGMREEVFWRLKEIIAELIGNDAAEIIGIRKDSEFVGDLGMDSIQIVSFAEEVRNLYGNRVNFISWLSKMPFQEMLDLTVGDVVDFIEGNR
jgi:acyl carrier protein